MQKYSKTKVFLIRKFSYQNEDKLSEQGIISELSAIFSENKIHERWNKVNLIVNHNCEIHLCIA